MDIQAPPEHARLPDLPDPPVPLADIPDWRYRSACAAGYGIARLRLYAAGPVTLAVVTETGQGASITNSAEQIWQDLLGLLVELDRDTGRLVVLEHWPAEHSGQQGAHLDQVTAAHGPPRWRHIGPHAPAGSRQAQWWQRTGRALLT